MPISNPLHWVEQGHFQGPKYDKIVEMIVAINAAGGIGAHSTTHEDEGSDEISVTGLSGLLADAQTPTAHKTSHESGGGDLVDHNNLTNTHNLTTDINHSTITGTHNLTTDIDHNNINNYAEARHYLESEMSLANLGTKTHANLSDAPTDAHHPQDHDNTYHTTNYLANISEDSTPQLGGDLDLNQKQIGLNATALGDHGATGTIITLNASGTGVTLGDAVYINASGTLDRADADANTTMPAIGIALNTATSAACQVLISGYIRDDSWDWTDGGENGLIYISTVGTAGNTMTQTPPAGAGDQVQVIGHAIGTDYILVMPSPVLVEVA